MPESEFLCLGVSRSLRDYYAVGIDLGTGAWVRLVGSHPDWRFNGLDSRLLSVENAGSRRRMRPLDVVRLPIGERVRKTYQPENRILDRRIDDGPIPVLRCGATDEAIIKEIREWAVASSEAELLFESEEATSPESKDDKFPVSLFVVHSDVLLWRRTSEFNKGRDTELGQGPNIKGEFRFGKFSTPYCLPVSDKWWEFRAGAKIPSDRFIENTMLNGLLGLTSEVDTFLTISLDDDVIKLDERYRFIAGVLHLSKE